MPKIRHTNTTAQKRALRVRAKLSGTATRPRVSVYRSNRFIYAQAIDDTTAKVVAQSTDVRTSHKKGVTKSGSATAVAAELAGKLKKKKVTAVIFDRGQYKYHGRVKAVAESLREQGITV